jgi:hypothetical protein
MAKASESRLKYLRQPERFEWDPLKILINCTEASFNHVNLKCSECQTKNFSGVRLSCLVCADVDLCFSCFEGRGHPVQHPFAVIQNQLNRLGENKLGCLRETHRSDEEATQGLSWESYCDECEQFKESVFFTGLVGGFTLCKRCFKDNLALIQEHHVVQLLHVSPQLNLAEFEAQGGFGHEGRLTKLRHRASGREFFLSTVKVRVRDEEAFCRARNQLLKFRGNNIENVYAYREEQAGDCLKLLILEEFMANLTLAELLKSASFKTHSYRRRMGIFRSLASALKMIHSLQLFHGNLSPESILLDRYHEVRLELLPFVNRHASTDALDTRHNPFAEKEGRGLPSDIYSLGLLMNLVLTGEPHFEATPPQFKKLQLFATVISRCIGPMQDRPTAAELDAYFTRFDKTFWAVVAKKIGRK